MNLNPLLLEALASATADKHSEASAQDLLLSQLEERDPTVAMLAKYLTQSGNEEIEEAELDLEEAEKVGQYDLAEVEVAFEAQQRSLESAEDKILRITQAARRLKSRLQEQSEELQQLRDRNDTLADALGACPFCWGEDLSCTDCHGRGRPGGFLPDKEQYSAYVIPATNRVRRKQTELLPGRVSAPTASYLYGEEGEEVKYGEAGYREEKCREEECREE